MKASSPLFGMAAAPLASLFLLLAVLQASERNSSVGIDLWLPATGHSSQESLDQCGDDRLIVVQFLPAGRAQINQTGLSQREVPGLLKRIFQARNQRWVFYEADPSLTAESVYEVLGDAQGLIDRLRIIPITPGVKHQLALSNDYSCGVSNRLWQREWMELSQLQK
jgi:hypothetical protein